VIGVLALELDSGPVTTVSSIVNPDKLTHLGPVGDLKSMLRSAN
jgi:RNA polymerase sigma-70 factor (ECF subfamily)